MPNDSAPAIFMDSHPDEQDGYLKSWLTTIRTNLTIAATGIVERGQKPGELRLKWYTHDGNVGYKDYPLEQYEKVREEFHSVLGLPEVRRAIVLGYPAQNPFILIGGSNPWVDKFEREKEQKQKMIRDQQKREAKLAAMGGEFLNIELLVRETEKEEQKRIQLEAEAEAKMVEEIIRKRQGNNKVRYADEEEGLLSRKLS
ncbi:hypothetical protein GcM1_236001 [Golovinomyces cichoracearum]|uniref:Uncharacterized protein n=1 Tax=Golovinomyces cichoracearum TaxID=62708 RepID=A0A420IKE0_9PEZI|nr:hypothetical protein GcM1_236001 [Golovinomyces cichoracearum]